MLDSLVFVLEPTTAVDKVQYKIKLKFPSQSRPGFSQTRTKITSTTNEPFVTDQSS